MSSNKNVALRNLAVAAGATALGLGAVFGTAGAAMAADEPATPPAVNAEKPAPSIEQDTPVDVDKPETLDPDEKTPEIDDRDDALKYEPTTVKAGHTAYAEIKGDVDEDTIFGYSQSGIPEGWFVSVDEETGKVSVSASPDAKPGDTYTVKVKVVDLDGKVTWAEAPFTVGE
ncbi:YPDG domain-containing protein [Corynebacterium pseudotuberculosis]|uniref:YPDG domain-containing protein n=1 Tax=Corynebacterium pseudotuberculosis TaxID=1719 RepID=UPI000259338A|nr:YPDG domain-containing protein [Corynebacterium pseudotuberculosis]AFH89855.3 hypothetical protein CP31_00075 [Corynebacterium pseudotuberculosis 31]